MDLDKILLLGKMGYSKEDIELMSLGESEKEAIKETDKEVDDLQEKKLITHPNGTTNNDVKTDNLLSDSQFEKLVQALNKNNANIDVPPTQNIAEILKNHYASMFGGKIEEV